MKVSAFKCDECKQVISSGFCLNGDISRITNDQESGSLLKEKKEYHLCKQCLCKTLRIELISLR
jgi:hypothetical protein